MPAGRDEIPLALQRALFVEAGHRCAIPTCRAVAPLQIEHIEDWARVKEHKFDNMIVLCANCHGLKGEGPRKLDRKSLHQYKANLAIINGRYGDVERRVLEVFAKNPAALQIQMPGGWDIALMYLIEDGLLVKLPPQGAFIVVDGIRAREEYMITPAGRDFVTKWAEAQPVSAEAGALATQPLSS
jgi:hypothetical protein